MLGTGKSLAVLLSMLILKLHSTEYSSSAAQHQTRQNSKSELRFDKQDLLSVNDVCHMKSLEALQDGCSVELGL